jgi:ArsR family transcriptional regulator, arsenate/arsenite/antimonite-responsive transcriptional repressor
MSPRCCPPPPDAAGHEPDDELALLTKALGHPARVRMLRFLLDRDECIVANIVDELPLAQSTVSQHLKVLRNAGLIRGEVDGSRICYCADPARIERLRELLDDLVSAPSPAADRACAPAAAADAVDAAPAGSLS